MAYHDSSFGLELAHRAPSSGAGEAKAHTGCQAGPPGEGQTNLRSQTQVADVCRKWAQLVAP